MARNPRAKAQRENAARIREFRRSRDYQSAIPRSYKSHAADMRMDYLDSLLNKDPSTLTEYEQKQAASAASFGAHGKEGYEAYDTEEWRAFWYHEKGK